MHVYVCVSVCLCRAILQSFCPAGRSVREVTVYYSDFGLQRLEQEIQQLQQELQAQQQNSGSGQDASASQPAGDATNTQSGMGAWWDRERGWGRYEGFGSRFRPAWGRRW